MNQIIDLFVVLSDCIAISKIYEKIFVNVVLYLKFVEKGQRRLEKSVIEVLAALTAEVRSA